MKKCCMWMLAVVLLGVSGFAQQAIPSPAHFLGDELGARFTPWDRIIGYFDRLESASPLITVERFGETPEGRPLIYAVVTSAKNREAIAGIRRRVASMANAEADSARAAEIARTTPAIVWLGFGVHGNESSSAEAAMLVASTLLREAEATTLLDNLVIIIDPLQNPDGRERYVQWFTRTRGARPNANPDGAEHFEPWPGGRFSHYLIDMNRDWAWSSQQESRARIRAFREWNPQVFVDFHEMGHQSTYFFPPDAKPINANVPADAEKWLEVFGRANAAEFSRRGWPFFVAERFDLFYPGYGDSWPSLQGSIGMTYEVAGGGRAGSAITRDDGTTLLLADRINRHFVAGMVTLRTAALNREQLLLYTYDSARQQIESATNTFLLVPGSPNFEPLLELLVRQGIRVGRLGAPATLRASRIEGGTAQSRTFAAGTAVVSTKQALGRLAQTLLERSPAIAKEFLEEQRRKAEADESDDFYDLTTWSLPLAMNVEAYVTTSPVTGDVRPHTLAAAAAFRAGSYGYVINGHDPNAYRFAGQLLREEINFSVSEDVITLAEQTLPRGSLVVLKGNNRAEVDTALQKIARDLGVTVHPVTTGWSGATSFGSEKLRFVRQPKIGLVGGSGVGPTSFGMLWHTLDVDTPVPHTVLSLDTLRNLDLSRYRVLVFPDGEGYADRLGKKGIEKLQTWIRDGGTLIAVKGASAFLREKDVEISKVKLWEPPKPKEGENPREERYNQFRVPGSAFRTTMNVRSYLTFGLPRPPAVLIEGTAAYQPVSHKVDNIVTIVERDPLLSGVAWPESIERLEGSAFMVSEPYGRGAVITFADDPHYRLFWRGTLPLFLNAVLYAPSFPR